MKNSVNISRSKGQRIYNQSNASNDQATRLPREVSLEEQTNQRTRYTVETLACEGVEGI